MPPRSAFSMGGGISAYGSTQSVGNAYQDSDLDKSGKGPVSDDLAEQEASGMQQAIGTILQSWNFWMIFFMLDLVVDQIQPFKGVPATGHLVAILGKTALVFSTIMSFGPIAGLNFLSAFPIMFLGTNLGSMQKTFWSIIFIMVGALLGGLSLGLFFHDITGKYWPALNSEDVPHNLDYDTFGRSIVVVYVICMGVWLVLTHAWKGSDKRLTYLSIPLEAALTITAIFLPIFVVDYVKHTQFDYVRVIVPSILDGGHFDKNTFIPVVGVISGAILASISTKLLSNYAFIGSDKTHIAIYEGSTIDAYVTQGLGFTGAAQQEGAERPEGGAKASKFKPLMRK